MALASFDKDVLDDVVLAVEDYVSEFTKVLDDVLGVKIAINDCHVAYGLEIRILDELFDDWIEDSVELTVLWEPRPATETKSWIWIL